MATTFTNALNLSGRAIGIAYENKFLGENFGNYSRVKRITFDGIVDSRFSNTSLSGVSESLSSISDILSTAEDSLSVGFVINGTNFGKGVITSIDFTEKENPVRWGYYTASLEIYEPTGVLTYNMADEFSGGANSINSTVGGFFTKTHLLDDFSEEFSFEVGEDGGYSYDHSLNIKYISGEAGTDFVTEAKNLANSFLTTSSQPDFGFALADYQGKLNDANLEAGKHLFNESYDLVDLSFSFTKRFSSINKKVSSSDGLFHKHSRSITRAEDGFITVTENGQIQHVNDLSTSQTYLNGITGGLTSAGHSAYDRCFTLFTSFVNDNIFSPISAGAGGTGPAGTGPLGTQPEGGFEGSASSLYSEPTEVSISKNPHDFTIDYGVTFTNNPRYTANGIVEYNHDISYDYSVGAAVVSEKGTVRPYGQKDPNFDASSLINSTITSADSRISSLLYDFGTYNYNKIIGINENWAKTNVSVDYPKDGQSISYTVTYQANGTYLNSVDQAAYGINSITAEVSDTNPQHMMKNFLVPNFEEIRQFGGQTEIATRSISMEAQRIRTSNYLTNPPNINTITNLMINIGLGKMLDIVKEKTVLIKEMFISGLNYSFDSQSGKITMSFDVSYIAVDPPYNQPISAKSLATINVT